MNSTLIVPLIWGALGLYATIMWWRFRMGWFFRRLGQFVAWVALVVGVLIATTSVQRHSSFLNLLAGTEWMGQMTDAQIKAELTMASQMVELGIGMALFGIVLGVLIETRARDQK